MADTKVSNFPPSAGLVLTDIFPVVDDPGGTPVAQKATFTQLASLLGTGNFVLKTGDTMTGSLSVGNGALVSSAPVLSLSQTWNNAAEVFTGFLTNITDTASNGNSEVADFQLNSVSLMTLLKSGQLLVPGTGTFGGLTTGVGGLIMEGTGPLFSFIGVNILFNEGQTAFMGTGEIGFFSVAPVFQQSAPTNTLAEVLTALRAYGLLAP